MELWIRSQDRENTVKINRQYGLHWKDKTMIIADYQPDFVGKEGEYYELLGKYESKERALEILDEIQNILMPKYIINSKSMKFSKPYEENGMVLMDCNADARLEQLSTYVYEMPED